jgi:hypothetical protein
MQMAAWEFAAGPCPRIGATLFCLPLVAIGLFVVPRLTFRAFVRGRASRTLYGTHLRDRMLDAPLATIARDLVPIADRRATSADLCAFIFTASALAVLVTFPIWLGVIAMFAIT